MKKIVALSVLCFGMVCAYAQTPATKTATKPATKPAATATTTTTAPASGTVADAGYSFDKMVYDYGTIDKGADPYCEFQLTNNSKEPLVIQEAHGSCGCTVPEYPKDPIKPGQTVTIRVRYDTNRVGPFDKSVTITFQGKDQPAVLKIHGVVKAPPADTPFPGPGQNNSNSGAPVNGGN
ncbi:MAG TPA: DUF1573 domain-containing protein [Bacteroidia bacterium]|nr:DUF1573 domain-containing protein [Bacteroidia bacterium]